jgi:ABC-type dipeptide/oligopeptide/nickel transport system ATPase component
MVFQEPGAALNPVRTVGDQIGEVLRAHQPMTRHEAWSAAIRLLGDVGIPEPERRAKAYPFELSGGMRQRAVIAIAMSVGPKLLIADEPTTALDVTVQAEILDLLRSLQERHGMAILLITHDLGVVAEMAKRVMVMYTGKIVEVAPADALFEAAYHPYTKGLLASIQHLGAGQKEPLRHVVLLILYENDQWRLAKAPKAMREWVKKKVEAASTEADPNMAPPATGDRTP